jgi:hypothetical protein
MVTVDRDQRRFVARAVKERAAVDNVSAEFDCVRRGDIARFSRQRLCSRASCCGGKRR